MMDAVDKAINTLFSMSEYLKGIDVFVSGSGQVKCPFHNDSHPSAKIYEDKKLYCFTEAKQFTIIDVVRTFYSEEDYRNLRKYVIANHSKLVEDFENGRTVDGGARVDTTPIEPFLKDEIDLPEFFLRLSEIGYVQEGDTK